MTEGSAAARKAITENPWLVRLHHEKIKGERITLAVILDGRRKRRQLEAP